MLRLAPGPNVVVQPSASYPNASTLGLAPRLIFAVPTPPFWFDINCTAGLFGSTQPCNRSA